MRIFINKLINVNILKLNLQILKKNEILEI